MKKTIILAVVAIATIFVTFHTVDASKNTVLVKTTDLSTFVPSEEGLGKYYVLKFELPDVPHGKRLENAVLEFSLDVASFTQGDFRWLDADSVEHVGYTAKTPVIEIYALKSPILSELQPDQLEISTAARRPVLVGRNRRVVVDITPIVIAYFAEPSRNHGIVMGSLSGTREGDFTLNRRAFPDRSIAKVHFEFGTARE